MRRPVSLLAAALLALTACSRGGGPAERYRTFAAAARAGDADTVWDALSKKSRAEYDARAQALAARTPAGLVPASGKALVRGDFGVRAPRLASVVVVRESADAAVVRVEEEGGAAAEVELVREGGAWRVVLPPPPP